MGRPCLKKGFSKTPNIWLILTFGLILIYVQTVGRKKKRTQAFVFSRFVLAAQSFIPESLVSVSSLGQNLSYPNTIGYCWESGCHPNLNAVPLPCQVVKRLPKTRSGKVMRRLLRKIITGRSQDLGDTTTLEDPSVITEILSAYQKYKDKQAASQ